MKEYVSYKNRGMLLEELINKTINFYNQEQIGYFAKNHFHLIFLLIANDRVYVF